MRQVLSEAHRIERQGQARAISINDTDQQPPVLVDAVRGRFTAWRAGVPRELASERRPSSDRAKTWERDEGELSEDESPPVTGDEGS
jgi:hypothetical protein